MEQTASLVTAPTTARTSFALLGDHPAGVAMARALVATGSYQLAYHAGRTVLPETDGVPPIRRLGDVEEILADPAVELVIVASAEADRPAQLRRAIQSERDVLCVHPADRKPDIAYEAAMMQQDTRRLVFPLLVDALHPAIVRLTQVLANDARLRGWRLLVLEWSSPDQEALVTHAGEARFALPCWDILRALGGEVLEVSALGAGEELEPGQPLLLSGRFEEDRLFQIRYLPGHGRAGLNLRFQGGATEVHLHFPQGMEGPAFLTWEESSGELYEEYWGSCDPWLALAQLVDQSLRGVNATNQPGHSSWSSIDRASEHTIKAPLLLHSRRTGVTAIVSAEQRGSQETPVLSWQTEIRCLELDDAARRSLERRRTSLLDYQEPSEEVGFKGTMTLVGCGLLWVTILLAVLSRWVPALGWLIVPVLFIFLVLQILGAITRRTEQGESKGGTSAPGANSQVGR